MQSTVYVDVQLESVVFYLYFGIRNLEIKATGRSNFFKELKDSLN